MHGGGYGALVSLAWVIFYGVVCLLIFLAFVIASKKHSFHGIKGWALYLLVSFLLISLGAALDNLLWDFFSIRNQFVTLAICVPAAYILPLAFIMRIYRKEGARRVNAALLCCTTLLVALLSFWYFAESAG